MHTGNGCRQGKAMRRSSPTRMAIPATRGGEAHSPTPCSLMLCDMSNFFSFPSSRFSHTHAREPPASMCDSRRECQTSPVQQQPQSRRTSFPRLPHRPRTDIVFPCRFKVEDEARIGPDELLSWACIRLDRLRPGYRYVRLMDKKGRPIKDGKLLVRIHKDVR